MGEIRDWGQIHSNLEDAEGESPHMKEEGRNGRREGEGEGVEREGQKKGGR